MQSVPFGMRIDGKRDNFRRLCTLEIVRINIQRFVFKLNWIESHESIDNDVDRMRMKNGYNNALKKLYLPFRVIDIFEKNWKLFWKSSTIKHSFFY